MSIRLNKAIRELNIGLQTAVEFLEKRKELGEVKDDQNFKLSDAQYNALVKAFKSDKDVKDRAANFLQQKQREKEEKKPQKKSAEKAQGTVPGGIRQKYKPLGKLDLNNLGKGPVTVTSANSEKKETEQAAVSSAPEKTQAQKAQNAESAHNDTKQVNAESEKKQEVTAEAPKATETKLPETAKPKQQEAKTEAPAKAEPAKAEVKADKPEQPKTAEQSKAEANVKAPKDNAAEKTAQAAAGGKAAENTAAPTDSSAKSEDQTQQNATKKDSNIFMTKNERQMLNQPKMQVLGKIDLNSINQSTRPKKKTKEERRREREEKAQNNGNRKKRVRIKNERVDINAAAKQAGKNNGNNNGNGGGKKNKKNRGRGQKSLEVDDEAVARQVKETLARLTSKSQNKKGAKYRKEKREAVQEKINAEQKAEKKESKTLKLTEFVTVSELATMMNIPVTKLISTLMSVGIMVSINQRLDAETINLVADEFGFKTEYVSAEVQEAVSEEQDDENDLVPRAPIVTVMGHVDHGKTSLLDHIRNTNVIAGEAGGITQHIGAYSVKLKNGREITFLDTPGHEAFTAMRARGAQVTDIAIIIIAADDSVMPTTKEAIAHCQAAGVPMIFAINKIDKPGANPDRIREDLANMNLLVEEWGGKYQCQEISAKKGLGVDELLDKVLLEADMMDLKANPNRKATGTVIESSLDKGRGYVSTVLVSNGTLHVGDIVLAGTCFGRVKALFNERNQNIDNVQPAEPAVILGLNGAPTAGDQFHVMDTEQEARDIANKREQLQREQGLRTQTRLTLSDISHRIARGEFHELNIIVKGDTDGSVEALSDSFLKLSTEKVQVNVISKAVGQISENDVMLASASDAIIVGFQVRPSADARKLADREGVEINTYSVIYDAIDDIKSAMVGMLDKVKKEVVTGEIEVKQVFKISKVGTVAGGLVTEGKVHNKDKARVVRDGIVLKTAPIGALKRYKDDVKEVATGLECGISLVNNNDIQVGDVIETFTEIEVEQKL